MRRPGFLLVVGALVVPASAFGQETPPPAPPPAPVPAGGHIKLVPEELGGGRRVAVAGVRWRVRGVVAPFIPGQRVTVRFSRGSRVLRTVDVAIRPGPGRTGAFVVGFVAARAGRVVVRATHDATPLQLELVANPKAVTVVAARARPGTRGPAVGFLQGALARAGYAVPRSGAFDAGTARAVLAFRKVTGMARTTEARAEVFRRLAAGGGRFRVRFPGHGKHVEADLGRQVLALIASGGQVQRIYVMSSGKPSTPTPVGHFRVYLKQLGVNAKGMVDSNYFLRGYAVHGYFDVPTFAASHGCLRVPIPDALPIYRWLRVGNRVDIYR